MFVLNFLLECLLSKFSFYENRNQEDYWIKEFCQIEFGRKVNYDAIGNKQY